MTEEQKVQLNEAPASVNFYGVTAAGWNIQVTLRDSDEMHLMARFADLVKWLESKQVHPKPVGQQPAGGGNGHSVPPPPAPVSQPAKPANPLAVKEQVEGVGAYDGVFDASELVGTMAGGKTYWKVKGGQFTKFGVTVWPEVLKDAGLATDLDPMQVYSLQGYKAFYVTKDEGKPDKVVKLEK